MPFVSADDVREATEVGGRVAVVAREALERVKEGVETDRLLDGGLRP